jgi:hypothetical protein
MGMDEGKLLLSLPPSLPTFCTQGLRPKAKMHVSSFLSSLTPSPSSILEEEGRREEGRERRRPPRRLREDGM